MASTLKSSKGPLANLAYIFLVPGFFIAFSLLYNPFGILADYTQSGLGHGFHITMLTCIILVTLIISRGILTIVGTKIELKWWQYGVWCASEAFLSACFIALYTCLFNHTDAYFNTLATCVKFVFLTLVYPYLLLILLQIIRSRDEEMKAREAAGDGSLVKFHDEHHRLKLSIAPAAILFVSAESNYVDIHYMDSGKVRHYLLRNSMKSVESATKGTGIVRCHRSYFVNPKHVTVLRKDSEGAIFAELNIPEVPGVPVSKQYFPSVSDLL